HLPTRETGSRVRPKNSPPCTKAGSVSGQCVQASGPPQSELDTHRELNDSRIDRSCGDQPEVCRARVQRLISHDIRRQRKLRVVEQVEELASELDALIFANLCGLGDREIGIGLSRPAYDADTGVAEVGAIAKR